MIVADTHTYATVWEINDKGNYSVINLSTSRKKDKNLTEYVNSNWRFVSFLSKAHDKSRILSPRDRIIITRIMLTNEPYTPKEGEKRDFFKLSVLDFEYMTPKPESTPTQSEPTDYAVDPNLESDGANPDECPF